MYHSLWDKQLQVRSGERRQTDRQTRGGDHKSSAFFPSTFLLLSFDSYTKPNQKDRVIVGGGNNVIVVIIISKPSFFLSDTYRSRSHSVVVCGVGYPI